MPGSDQLHVATWEELTAASKERDALRAVILKHYPTIAGHVMRLQEGYESRAAAEWEAVAHDFASAVA